MEKVVPVAFAAIVPAAIAPVATPKDAPPTSGKDAPAGTPSPSLVAVVETKSADSANSNALRVESTPPTAATQPPPQLLPLPEPMSEGEPQPVYRRAWFWAAAVGALVLVGGGVAVGALASTHVPSGSLGMADWR